jgi:hypothetical protein
MDQATVIVGSGATIEYLAGVVRDTLGIELEHAPRLGCLSGYYNDFHVMVDLNDEDQEVCGIEYSKYDVLVDVETHDEVGRLEAARRVFHAVKASGKYRTALVDAVTDKIDEFIPSQ